jgi:hypothetical protein
VSSGYIPAKDEPGPDEILEALREAIFDNPRLTEVPSEEVARQLALGGHLQEEASPALVARTEVAHLLMIPANEATSSGTISQPTTA